MSFFSSTMRALLVKEPVEDLPTSKLLDLHDALREIATTNPIDVSFAGRVYRREYFQELSSRVASEIDRRIRSEKRG